MKNPGQNTGVMERIYPTRFNKELNIQINREILEENEKRLYRRERRIFVNPLFTKAVNMVIVTIQFVLR